MLLGVSIMRQEVLDMPKKIQDMVVPIETLCVSRLLITGSDMVVLEVPADKITTAFHMENL